MLRAYIESNLEFIAANPNQLRAVVEIARAKLAATTSPLNSRRDTGTQILAGLLARFQATGDFRNDFDTLIGLS